MVVTVGQRFTRLVVTEFAEVKWGKRRCIVRCDCGTEKTVCLSDLVLGKTRSCKCLDMEKRLERNTKHGQAKRGQKGGLYYVWVAMVQRCTNPKNKSWEYYGGRGITTCDRWQNSFTDFVADMGNRPTPKHQIDRQDNNGNYEPGNCKWVTPLENNRNKRARRWKKRPVTPVENAE